MKRNEISACKNNDIDECEHEIEYESVLGYG